MLIGFHGMQGYLECPIRPIHIKPIFRWDYSLRTWLMVVKSQDMELVYLAPNEMFPCIPLSPDRYSDMYLNSHIPHDYVWRMCPLNYDVNAFFELYPNGPSGSIIVNSFKKQWTLVDDSDKNKLRIESEQRKDQ